jgi:hypothetical protein
MFFNLAEGSFFGTPMRRGMVLKDETPAEPQWPVARQGPRVTLRLSRLAAHQTQVTQGLALLASAGSGQCASRYIRKSQRPSGGINTKKSDQISLSLRPEKSPSPRAFSPIGFHLGF